MSTPSTEFSGEFVSGMEDRMGVSYAKYGPVANAYPHKINAMESVQQRIDKYHATGNKEWLIDAANFLMIEFMHPRHPKAHFRATESHESPGRVSDDEGVTNKANDDLTDDGYKALQEYLHSKNG
jgi:hypothetical protein